MLTLILIIGAEATSQGHYRLRYLPISAVPPAPAQPTQPPTTTSQAASKLKPRVATASLAVCTKRLISPGLCFSVRLRLSGNSTPTITWLEEAHLPKHHYSLAVPGIVEHLPLPIDQQSLSKALLKIGEHPVLLARLLDAPTPVMLEHYTDQYSALKLHQAWHARKALEAASLHLSSLNLPSRLAPNLCSVQLPLTSPITKQRLALDIQTRTLSTQACFFRTETKLLLCLTHARSQGVSLVDRDQLIITLKSTADCVDKVLSRLEANASVKLINSRVMLSNEYYLESSLHDALTQIESYELPPQFYHYEIDDCVERVSLQRREPPNSSISAAVHQCLNNRISTVYTTPATMFYDLLPLLSLVSQQIFNSRPIIIAPAAYCIEQDATPYGTVVALAHLKSYRFRQNDSIIIALDADTYSKCEFLTLLRGMAANHRLLIHGTSYSGLPDFVSKVQYLISHAYPFITLNDSSLANCALYPVIHLAIGGEKQSTRVYFNIDLPYLFRLLLRTKAIAFVPSTRQAVKMSKLLHTRRKRTTCPSIRTSGTEFFKGDRIIFLGPLSPLDFEINPIGIILSVQESSVLMDFSGTCLPITAATFINSNPSPCYFLSIEQFKRTKVEKSIVILPKNGQSNSHYMQLAQLRSNITIGVTYGINNRTITSPKMLPITNQTMMNIIPHLGKT
ncbi:hypothetical protein DEU51_11493 [Pseudomonas jessenii]|uniref:Uncharacterized protein n=2 Tax=Pseudomonas jessenii TaxID=77298 RepID=A0A370S8X7_PSEJE|nr:hypothetical protein DEU51_11493 [Pseudomonas jessenii]